MATSISRFVSRLALASFRLTAVRTLTVRSPIVKLNVTVNNPASVLSHVSSNKRFYASDVKFTADQVEGKIMEILSNFDRVKENPAKPAVRTL